MAKKEKRNVRVVFYITESQRKSAEKKITKTLTTVNALAWAAFIGLLD